MGVYIPNMEKPKDCKECQWHLDFYIEDEQVGGLCTITEKDDKENICPLIEMGDIEYQAYKQISTTLLKRIEERILYGERRADGNKRRSV